MSHFLLLFLEFVYIPRRVILNLKKKMTTNQGNSNTEAASPKVRSYSNKFIQNKSEICPVFEKITKNRSHNKRN